MGRRLVIGDVHGCIKTLRFMVEEMMQLSKHDQLWLLGDMIDRGPGSREVIDYILKLRLDSYQVTALMGNHEFMMIEGISDPYMFDCWMENSGETTLKEFGISYPVQSALAKVPEVYLDFLRNLPNIIEIPGFVLVHAGLDPYSDPPSRNREYLLWNRTQSHHISYLGDRRLVHGHTPRTLMEIRTILEGPAPRIIPLDSGCVYRNRPGMGYLSGLDLDQLYLFSKENLD